MTTPFFETILNNADKFSPEKLQEIYEHDQYRKLMVQIYEEAHNELQPLIEENKQAIEAEKKYFFKAFSTRKAEVENKLENLSPKEAYAYLVNYEIELSKNIIADDDYSGLSRHCKKQIDLLKGGDVKKYVEIRDKHDDAIFFKDFCLTTLLAEYKKRAAALPKVAPAPGGGAGERADTDSTPKRGRPKKDHVEFKLESFYYDKIPPEWEEKYGNEIWTLHNKKDKGGHRFRREMKTGMHNSRFRYITDNNKEPIRGKVAVLRTWYNEKMKVQ